jgi:acetate kinase
MGFTPLEGLVMATRSGSVDPGLLLWLVTEAGMPAHVVSRALETESGLAGLTGRTGDMRDVLAARDAGDEHAVLAFDLYVHRLVKEIAAMTAALGRLNALVFTGGVGEHVPEVRATVASRLAFLGVHLDPDRNTAARADAEVSADGAQVATLVVEAREDLEIARQTRSLLAPAGI